MINMAVRPFQNTHPEIKAGVYVDPSAVVSGHVILGKDVSVWPCASIRGDLLSIQIGDRSNIQDGSSLHTTHISRFNPKGSKLTIGEDVTIGHNVTLHGCTLENRILIGMGSIILDDSHIESDVMVGAGSLVGKGKVLKSGFLYYGNPVKQIRPLAKEELEFLKYSAENYVKLKDQTLESLESLEKLS